MNNNENDIGSEIDQKNINKRCCSGGGCSSFSCDKLDVYDWLKGVENPKPADYIDFVEVKFKNSHKGIFTNVNKLNLEQGDIVVIEASPGYDVGVVSLTGDLVHYQMKKKNISDSRDDKKKIYRKAKPEDLEKWGNAISLEEKTKYRARELAVKYGLKMKISDVEFQGDRSKAIFYYTADGRVDFRELIKSYAEEFKIRIEMKQIGARQEAGLVGGIGSCGRELCCSTWYNELSSVNTSAARDQQLSLNPLKLAGQCGKLKCCLNYEHKCYVNEQKDFPKQSIKLETKQGIAFHQKTDVYKGLMWYSLAENPHEFIELTVDRVNEIIKLNKKGVKVDELVDEEAKGKVIVEKKLDYENVVGQDSLTRFDKKKKRKNPKNKRNNNNKSSKPEANKANAEGQNKNKPQKRFNKKKKSQFPGKKNEGNKKE